MRRTGQSRGRPGAQAPPPLAGSPRAPVQSWTTRLATPNICSDSASGTHQDTWSQVTNEEIQLANQHKNLQPQQELKKCKFKRNALSPIHVAKSARNPSHPTVLTGPNWRHPFPPCPIHPLPGSQVTQHARLLTSPACSKPLPGFPLPYGQVHALSPGLARAPPRPWLPQGHTH